MTDAPARRDLEASLAAHNHNLTALAPEGAIERLTEASAKTPNLRGEPIYCEVRRSDLRWLLADHGAWKVKAPAFSEAALRAVRERDALAAQVARLREALTKARPFVLAVPLKEAMDLISQIDAAIAQEGERG